MVAYNLREVSNDKLKYIYEISLSNDDINQEVEQKINKYSGTLNLRGFRPGKASPAVIRQQLGSSIRDEVRGEALKNAQEELCKKFNMATSIEPLEQDESDGFLVRVAFEILPEIEDIDLSELVVDNFICHIEDSDVEAEIEVLRSEQHNFIARGNKDAEDGNAVDADFKIFVDNNIIKGGDVKNYRIVLGQGQMIADFENQLLGMCAGDEKTFNFVFPVNYHAKHLAGKEAQAWVKVINVLVLESLQDNEALAHYLNCSDYAELYNKVRSSLQHRALAMSKEIKTQQVFDQLESKLTFYLPEHLVQKEIAMLAQSKGFATADHNLLARVAERRVRIGLFVLHTGKKNNIMLEQHDISEFLTSQMSAAGSKGRELLDFYMRNAQAKDAIARQIIEEKTMNFILAAVRNTERNISFVALKEEHEKIGSSIVEEIQVDAPEHKKLQAEEQQEQADGHASVSKATKKKGENTEQKKSAENPKSKGQTKKAKKETPNT